MRKPHKIRKPAKSKIARRRAGDFQNVNEDLPIPTSSGANKFLVLLAKNMVRTEAAQYFDIDTASICWYIYLRSESPTYIRRNEFDLPMFLYDERKSRYPEGYVGFARHMWDKLENFSYSKSNLDKLVRGITLFGSFHSWEAFVNKFESCEGKLWADKFNGDYIDDMDRSDKRTLQLSLDGYFHQLHNQLKFSGKLKGITYRYKLSETPFLCFREAITNDLPLIDKIMYEGIGPRLNIVDRTKILQRNDAAFFVIENEFDHLVGSICVLPYRLDERCMISFELKDILGRKEARDATAFWIRELYFSNDTYKDQLLEGVLRILGIQKHGAIVRDLNNSGQIYLFAYSDIQFGYSLIDYGFVLLSQDLHMPMLYRAPLSEIEKYTYLNLFDLPKKNIDS